MGRLNIEQFTIGLGLGSHIDQFGKPKGSQRASPVTTIKNGAASLHMANSALFTLVRGRFSVISTTRKLGLGTLVVTVLLLAN